MDLISAGGSAPTTSGMLGRCRSLQGLCRPGARPDRTRANCSERRRGVEDGEPAIGEFTGKLEVLGPRPRGRSEMCALIGAMVSLKPCRPVGERDW